MRAPSGRPITRIAMAMLPWRHFRLRRARVRRLRRVLTRDQCGFSLIEVVFALVLFEIVGASLIGLLTSATAASNVARQRTIAQQAALSQIESIRSLDYDSVGLQNGNPPGTLVATQAISNGGFIGTLTTKVSYVNDPGPLSYTSYANYKKVVVTVKRTRDSKQLAQEVTYVAPPIKASETNAVIKATVYDYNNNNTFEAPVSLSTGPSAPRNDTTDVSGSVTFAGLTPNPTSGSQAYYDLGVTPPSGYVTIVEAVSPHSAAHVQLAPGQTWQTALGIYKPATLYVQLKKTDGTPYTGSATVTVRYSREGTQHSQAFACPGTACTGGTLTVTAIDEGGSNGLVPLTKQDYTVSVSGSGISATPATVTATVPDSYPTTLTHTFAVTVNVVQLATVEVTVIRPRFSGCSYASGASVTISGGPGPININGSTDGNGQITFANVPIGSGYTIAASYSFYSDTLSNQTVAAGTNNFTVRLGSC